MFSLLLDTPPSSINISEGVAVNVNTDFRTFIRFEKIMFGTQLSNKEKVIKAFSLFGDFSPRTSDEANSYMNGIVYLYRCGKESKKLNAKVAERVKSKPKSPRYFDFDYDAPYIFAAFIESYGIDITEAKMHWWKFKALFDALPSDCQFSKIISYRGADTSQIKNKNEKQRMIKLQHIYALPRNLSESEKIAEAGKIFSGGGI